MTKARFDSFAGEGVTNANDGSADLAEPGADWSVNLAYTPAGTTSAFGKPLARRKVGNRRTADVERGSQCRNPLGARSALFF
jgi:hypothetical protein